MPEPWRYDGAEAARGAAGSDDQQLAGGFQRRVDAVAPVAHHGALAHIGPFAARNTRPFVNEFRDVGLAPAGGLQMVTQLLWNNKRIVS